MTVGLMAPPPEDNSGGMAGRKWGDADDALLFLPMQEIPPIQEAIPASEEDAETAAAETAAVEAAAVVVEEDPETASVAETAAAVESSL